MRSQNGRRADAPALAAIDPADVVRTGKSDISAFTERDTDPQALLPAILNEGWRVFFDPLQWILQRRKGDKWRDRCFCVTRGTLLRCIAEHCGPADLTAVRRLPDWHPDRTKIKGAAAPEAPTLPELPLDPVPVSPAVSNRAEGVSQPLKGDDCPLEYYPEGYPKLPACLDRRRDGKGAP